MRNSDGPDYTAGKEARVRVETSRIEWRAYLRREGSVDVFRRGRSIFAAMGMHPCALPLLSETKGKGSMKARGSWIAAEPASHHLAKKNGKPIVTKKLSRERHGEVM